MPDATFPHFNKGTFTGDVVVRGRAAFCIGGEAKLDLSAGFLYLSGKLGQVFFSAGSLFSVTSLACALCVAIAFIVLRRRRRNRRVRFRTILRALFPRRILRSPSHAADIGYFFFSVFLYGIVCGWAVLSFKYLSNAVIGGMILAAGPVQPTSLSPWISRPAMTVAIFLAYEFGYWAHHYLSHRVPFMWEFHKVHHQAEVLTPLTVFRVHPLDTVIYYNVLALFMGLANGFMSYVLGESVYQFSLSDTNLILVVFIHLYVHLQHTHLWISFRGLFGRVFMSPAHHQVHHSANPAHFNKNLGSCLAIWDWVFGTLYVPGKEPERLTFGVEEPGAPRDVHSVQESLIAPVPRALAHLRPSWSGRRAKAPTDEAVNPRPL
jgi:sterol desaturase/sphingolipid hydroxylase (fatty acid hydroxylase superfamily)